MSAQRLSDKKTRKWAAKLGLPIIRMWGHGGYTFNFVTDKHEHGWVNTKTEEWDYYGQDGRGIIHYSSCEELFPEAPRAESDVP